MTIRMTTIAVALLGALSAGCGDANEPSLPEPDDRVTWSGEVRALVEANCAVCHFTGGSAPFAFETYEDVKFAAPAMLNAIESGRMPPWPADPACRSYANERVLSEDDKATFAQWVEAGAPEGAATDPIVIVPQELAATHTVTAATPFTPDFSAAGDAYRCFLLDVDFAVPTWVHGTHVTPDTESVHHVLVFALTGDDVATAEALDAEEPGEGYTCFGGPLPRGSGASPGSGPGLFTQIAGWVPGAEPTLLPADTGIPIAAGARLVMQVHYSAVGGAPGPDQTALQLELSEQPPAFEMRTVPFAIRELDIPAGADDVRFTRTMTNWSDRTAWIVNLTGHMHLLGKEISAEKVMPSGEAECGLHIPEWDFDWQLNYELHSDAPLLVAPGDAIRISCSYDNTAGNQPFVDGAQLTPRDVEWGDGSLDEMCLVYARMTTPYVPPSAAAGSGACAASNACFAASDGTLTGLLECPETTAACMACAVQSGITCGLGPCALPLVQARSCVTDCGLAINAFGGAIATCLQATCGEAYDALLSCADPTVQSGACDDALATSCGLTTPAR